MTEYNALLAEVKDQFHSIDFEAINQALGARAFDHYCSAATYPPLKAMDSKLNSKEIVQEWSFFKNSSFNVYIHFPFCAQRCTFCHFNIKVSRDTNAYSNYVDSLIKEIKMYAEVLKSNKVPTVFIGGGTPSLMDLGDVDKILQCLAEIKSESKLKDILCMEIHPHESLIEKDYLMGLKRKGFNRVSIGVQDFNDSVLRATNRGHDRKIVIDVVTKAKEADLKFNLDLLFPLPYQTLENFLFTLNQTVELAPDEITFNITSVRESMAIYKEIKTAHFPTVDECFQMNILAKKYLEQNGYVETFPRKFEKKIANKKAYEGNYFTTSTIAFGAGAYSTLPTLFYYNAPAIKDYIRDVEMDVMPHYKSIKLDTLEALHREMVFFVRGGKINLSLVAEKFNVDAKELFKDQIDLLLKLELVTLENNLLAMTELGCFFRDEISKIFVSQNVMKRIENNSNLSKLSRADLHLNHFYEL